MTRYQAVVDSAAGLVPFGHLGWAYRDRDEFFLQAGRYVADGLAHGQWVEYVGAGDRDTLRAELTRLPGAAGLDLDQVATSGLEEFYDFPADSHVIDPDAAVRRRVAATEAALAAGYSGFRAVVDTTAVATTAPQRAAFARFEYLIDQKMAVLPVSALCAVDQRVLGDAAAELACLHPLTSPGAASFRLYTEPAVDAALAGEIDLVGRDAFTAALSRLGPLGLTDTLVLDATGLEFIDHHGLEALDRYAREHGRHLVLRTDREVVSRLAHLLELPRVRVEPVPATGASDTASGSTEEPADERALLRTQLHHRERRLASLPDIEQAKGMLMQDLGLDAQQAFDTLVRLSQQTNTKLRVVAALLRDELASTGTAHTRDTATVLLTSLRERLRDQHHP